MQQYSPEQRVNCLLLVQAGIILFLLTHCGTLYYQAHYNVNRPGLVEESSLSRSLAASSPNHYRPIYTCSKAQQDFQRDNFELISIHLCDSDHIWRLSQLAYPDASVFLDIGGNLGYAAARIFGLWSPGHGFNRIALYNAILAAIKENITSNHDQTTTFCRDGSLPDNPILCIGHDSINACPTRRNISVYSFDGQLQHVLNQRRIIYGTFPILNPSTPVGTFSRVKASWEYIHAALTENVPTDPAKRKGYFVVDKAELGALVFKPTKKVPTIEVPITTVDVFAAERHISEISFIKIDAEGGDAEVVRGALFTLQHRGVKMFTFECTHCLGSTFGELFRQLDQQLGYDCFLNSMFSIVVKLTQCWDFSIPLQRPTCLRKRRFCPTYLYSKGNNFSLDALDGNVYCIHRERGAKLLHLVENMALYQYASENRGDFHKDAFLGVKDAVINKDGSWKMKNNQPFRYWRWYGRNVETGEKVNFRGSKDPVSFYPFIPSNESRSENTAVQMHIHT